MSQLSIEALLQGDVATDLSRAGRNEPLTATTDRNFAQTAGCVPPSTHCHTQGCGRGI